MNTSIKCFLLITTLLLGITWSLQAQHFSNGSTISDALLSGREWHISSKIDGFPMVSLLNGGAGVVSDQPLNFDRTFIIEDGPDDGDGWTADVRWFHIRNRNNNLYLTVQGTNAGSVIGWELYHGSAGTGMWQQQFRLIATEVVGWYKLRSRLSQDGPDLVLTVGGDGMLTVQAPDLGASLDQKFAFNLAVPLDPSTNYMILGINNNDYISDQGISTDHTPVVHVEGFDYSCYWNFVFAGGNYLYIVNALTGNYLSNSGSSSAGDPLYMDQNPSENAKWSLLRRDATWSFQNKQSGYLISTKGQTGNRDPIFQSTSSGIGIKWALLPITQQDPEYLTGDYQHMLDEAGPINDCLEYGLQFQQALCERVGLPADDQYFNVLVDAVNAYYGDEILARQALQHFDLNNTGHRAELSFALRNYMVGTLAHKSPQQLTQPEMDLLTIFTDKVRLLRLLYAQRLAASAVAFEESINSGNIHLLSELLDNLNASDFVWPGEYEPGSYQQHVMEEYASATKTLGLSTNHQELGINIAMLIEPLAVPGIGVALTLSLKTGVSALAPAVDYTLAAEAVKAAQAAVRTTVAAGANAGTVITVAMIAAQLIAQEAMEAQEVARLGKRIIERIQWGQYLVNFRTIMTGADELAKLKLLSDLDYLMGAPLDQPFLHNTNDNSITTAFSLDCKSNVTVDLENNVTITLSPVMVLNSIGLPVCGGEINYNLQTSQFDCDDLGSHLVTLTASNSALSLACNTTVTIQDHTAPSITCKNATTYLDNGGTAAIGYPAIYDHGSDNCGEVLLQSISQTVFGCSHIGTNTITLTANDGHGNTATCNAVVTVTDNLPPTVTCKSKTVYLDANGQANTIVGDVFQSGVDNCGVVNLVSVAPNAFTCANIGSNSVVLNVNDGHGNQNSCTAIVTVVDNIAPTVVCQNKTIQLNAGGTANIITNDVFQNGTDNCGVVNQGFVTPNTFNCSQLGANTVILTANDGHGNTGTCTAVITVEDRIAPTMLCKPATLQLNAMGQATLTDTQVNNSSYDNCTISSYNLSRTLFTCADLGNQTVSLEGIDQSSNKAFCTATITVVDLIKPVAKCKNLTVNLASNGSVFVTPAQVNNGSSDNCSFGLSLTPYSFTCSNVGNNTVSLRATDGSGNFHTCAAVITVRDASAPSAICKNPTVYLNSTGQATITANDVDNGSTDACGISTRTINLSQVSCSNLGAPVSVTLTVKDVNNNSSSCLSNVTVKDNAAPTAVCENTTVKLGSNGTVTVYPSSLADNSFDNCAVWSYSPTAKVYTTAHLGNNNLTITVKDWSNNAATCVSVVTVLPFSNSNNLTQDRPRDFDFTMFPNPTSSDVMFGFDLPAEQPCFLRVFDLSGRLVYSHEYQGIAGENKAPITLNGIAAGVYIVDFQTEGLSAQKRLMVQE